MNGERNPSEVYVSFRDAVLKILGMSNGETGEHRNVPQSLEAEVSWSPFAPNLKLHARVYYRYVCTLGRSREEKGIDFEFTDIEATDCSS